MAAKTKDGRRIIADNRKARYNFEIEETLEAGLQLLGSEVKSLRLGHATIAESYASAEDGDIKLINAYIPEYTKASHFNHEPKRPRKLLLHRREIHKLTIGIQREGMTLVPLQLYFNDRGIAKLRLALAKGRKLHDKRDVSRTRDWEREKGRLLRDKG
jgi:SsrA-binding protein